MDFEITQWQIQESGIICVSGTWIGKCRSELWPDWEIEPMLRTLTDDIDVPIPGTTRRIRWSRNQIHSDYLIGLIYALPKLIPIATDRSTDILIGLQRELRRPLDRILSTTELFIHTQLTPEQFEYVDATRNASYDLIGIVNDVVDYTRLRNGNVELNLSPVSIRDLIQSSYEIATSRIDSRRIHVSVSLEPELPPIISTDGRLLQQVLVNILHNGVKYVKPGQNSSLEIKVRKIPIITTPKVPKILSSRRSNRLRSNSLTSIDREFMVEFKISDNGIGISKSHQGKLFDSFTRLDGSSGAGLGLTLAKLIVELMGGTISVESVPNSGSTFTFTITTQEARMTSPKELTMKQLEGRSVLIIDPDPTSRLELISLMMEHKLRAIGVGSRDEALLQLKVTPFDIIVMDTSMSPLPPVDNSVVIVIGTDNSEPQARGIVSRPIQPNRLLTVCSELLAVPEKARFPLNSRILIIDPSIPQLKIIRGILSKLGYVYVDTCSHGLEAIDRLSDGYHLVIFGDTKIPKKDAKSILKALDKAYAGKNRPYRPKTVLIVDTPRGNSGMSDTRNPSTGKMEDKVEGRFDGYLSKPLFPESVQAILAEIYAAESPRR